MIIGRALTNSYILRDVTYPYLSCALTVLVCSDKSKMLAIWSRTQSMQLIVHTGVWISRFSLPFGLEANNTLKGSFVFKKWAILQLCT